MFNMKTVLISLIVFLSLLGITQAACPVTIQSSTTNGFLQEIPTINSDLLSCPIDLPNQAAPLVGNGVVQVDIMMNDGSTQSFNLVVNNKQVTEINAGAATNPKFSSSTNENAINQMLQATDKLGTFLTLYANKGVTIKANTFTSQFVFFFAKPIFGWYANRNQVTLTPPVTYPKPANCDDTFLPGHRGYTENQAVWDGYTADSDGVCQSNNPVSCKYNIQLSVSGIPYYLCWYDN